MLSGTIILGCLLLPGYPGASETPPVPMNCTKISIPLTILESQRAVTKEVLLFISNDEGRTWEKPRRITPDKREFRFEAPADGIYWFIVATVNMQDQQSPSDVTLVPPSLKILVDTKKPDIRLQAERKGDRIHVHWDIDEPNPNTSTLKLEYQLADVGAPWYQVPFTKIKSSGEESFAPLSTAGVKVRMKLKDLADNEGQCEVFVPGTGPSPTAGGMQRETVLKGPEQEMPKAIAVTDGGSYSDRASPRMTPAGSLPQVTVVKVAQFKVEFEARCGRSGLSKADVYMTTDEGQHWDLPLKDVPVEVTNSMAGELLHASVLVNLPGEEMIYGIYIVAKSGAGLGEDPPTAGRAPELRIELDTQPPKVDLLQPVADGSRLNGVIFSWKAFDRNLDVNPITLEYCDTPNGEWKLIGSAALPNSGGDNVHSTGKFAWTIPYDLHNGKAYLRLTVRDQAGNLTSVVTKDPVVFDTVRPIVQHCTVHVGP